ncbi:hypothetical protein, partial [Cryptosporangium minutisporangium]|uniref:hypothetical protein n=1 Tax=Cryptosporangium minutisporangium TaxID=113569 RepID=UPI0035EEB6DF
IIRRIVRFWRQVSHMSSISVSSNTKDDFDELKPDDMTHDEFVGELLATYRAYNGEPVDHGEIARRLEETLIPMTEIAAYRGASEALEGD